MAGQIDFNFLIKLAQVACETTLPHFRQKILVTNKEKTSFDPVTIADQETERRLREIIHSYRSEDSIIGEEFPNYEGSNEYQWVIDPIDGTRSFISGLPIWGTLVGVQKNGNALIGMMVQPFTGEIFYTCGQGAYYYSLMNKTQNRLKVRNCVTIDEAILFTTAPELFLGQDKILFNKLKKSAKLTRFGTDCYAFAMLAAGHVDLVIEVGLKPYDIMALIPIIKEAGGVISQWNGEKAEYGGNIIAAATPKLYAKACTLLNS
ncbi:histidinol-phosphatase [Bartonella tamiae]|uniref:Histidinol-phosphatase n=1 Tax=Bartonella tamiae Th239 TaxID=1094558 RepID=J1JW43_9HYPH|nr:histidinol-phosphatase [Bartonella tamiae]EJF88800.1 histidinol-phosphate phosphatase HisN [Bartonella tamiae Th239]EJF94950.1 histidinol-phosphate phosphatase HisN [Bartonella tamiae Th307]